MNTSIFCVSPVAVGNTSPVKVCSLTGTRHIQAAIIERSPAFGVIECTIAGRSLRNTLNRRQRLLRSFNGEMCLSIGTATVLTPSRAASVSSLSPGELTATTSYPHSCCSSLSRPRQNVSSDSGTVDARMIFTFPSIARHILLYILQPFWRCHMRPLFDRKHMLLLSIAPGHRVGA